MNNPHHSLMNLHYHLWSGDHLDSGSQDITQLGPYGGHSCLVTKDADGNSQVTEKGESVLSFGQFSDSCDNWHHFSLSSLVCCQVLGVCLLFFSNNFLLKDLLLFFLFLKLILWMKSMYATIWEKVIFFPSSQSYLLGCTDGFLRTLGKGSLTIYLSYTVQVPQTDGQSLLSRTNSSLLESSLLIISISLLFSIERINSL